MCDQVVGRSTRCNSCVKAKQSCKFLIAEASGQTKGREVGPIRDAAEKSPEIEEEDDEEEEEEEEEERQASSPIARALKKIASPLRALGKRKTTELSPKSVQERDADSSQRARLRRSPSNVSVEVPVPSRSASSFVMPPPSTISAVSGGPYDPFYVRRLENELRESKEDLAIMGRRFRESQEDIGILLRRHASKESLLFEEIAALKGEYGESSLSRRGGARGSSEGYGKAGSSSGRY